MDFESAQDVVNYCYKSLRQGTVYWCWRVSVSPARMSYFALGGEAGQYTQRIMEEVHTLPKTPFSGMPSLTSLPSLCQQPALAGQLLPHFEGVQNSLIKLSRFLLSNLYLLPPHHLPLVDKRPDRSWMAGR
jgi:hypothetical protein